MRNVNMFVLNDNQHAQVKEWRKTHDCKLRTDTQGIKGEIYVGAIGGATTYSFTPNGIGMGVDVTCACGATLDLTDYDEW